MIILILYHYSILDYVEIDILILERKHSWIVIINVMGALNLDMVRKNAVSPLDAATALKWTHI